MTNYFNKSISLEIPIWKIWYLNKVRGRPVSLATGWFQGCKRSNWIVSWEMIVQHEGDPTNFWSIFQFARAVTLSIKKLRALSLWPGHQELNIEQASTDKAGIPEIQLISQLVQDISAYPFSELSWPFEVPTPMICKVVKGKAASDVAWICNESLVLGTRQLWEFWTPESTAKF
jgi:hypothetical protein